jgi:hypothetical protein
VFIEREDFSAFERGQTLINVRLGPSHTVGFSELAFGDAFVDQLARGPLDRWKIAARNMGREPFLLFRGKRDRLGPL